MNLATSLGLYAAVSRELCGELEWPGSEAFYSMATTFTASKLHAHFCVWAALAPGAANQAFNGTLRHQARFVGLRPHLPPRPRSLFLPNINSVCLCNHRPSKAS